MLSSNSSPVSNEAKLMAWMERNPHATKFPDYLDHIVRQMERKNVQVDIGDAPIVNWNLYNIEQKLEAGMMARSERHAIRQKLVEYMETNLEELPIYKPLYCDLLDKMRIARTTGAVGIDPYSQREIVAWDDKVNCVRLCPDDAREETQRLIRRYAPEVLRLLRENPRWRLFYAVYTQPNVKAGNLFQGKRDLFKDFSNFHRSKWAKQRIKGSFVIQEDPLATNDEDWHVHLNAIHIVEGRFDYEDLRKRWGNNVEVKQVKGTPEHISKMFLEVVKYAAKHVGEKSEDGKHTKSKGMTEWRFDQFHEWFSAGKGFRRSRTYGCLYRFKGKPDLGVSLDTVKWIGTINHDGYSYVVNFKKNLERIGVDLILSDNFASTSQHLANSGLLKPPLLT